jgi:hypothetical protein
MSGTTLIDHSNSRDNFDKPNPLSRPVNNNTSEYDEYKQKLLEKVEHDQRNGNSSFLDTLEVLRHEQRLRLGQVEHDYYNQKTASSSDISHHAQEEVHRKQETLVTSKPPIPKASRRSPSPVLLTEERAQHHMHRRPTSANIVRRHDDEIAFCPHRTCTDETTTVHDLTTNHVKNQIQSMWNEFELDDYLEQSM